MLGVLSSSVLVEPLVGLQTPRFLALPAGAPDRVNDFGDRAVRLAELAGLTLDPWQQLVLRSMLRTRVGSDQWAAYESLILVPRQNGKSVTLEAFDLAKLFLSPPGHMIMHTAHLFPTAMESFRHLEGLIRKSPDLWAEVARVSKAHGEEGFELRNGSRLRFAARGVNGAGRGFSPDDVIFDEAYRLPPDAEEALLYAISARKNPQLVYASSTGMADSEILWALVERGRTGSDASLMLAEWSADPALDISDEEQFWRAVRQANPALGYRLDERKTASEYRKALSQDRLEGFGRERLGLWAEVALNGIIRLERWLDLEDTTMVMEKVAAFAVEVSLDRGVSSIAAAGADGVRVAVEVVDRLRGTNWVVQRCVELNQKQDRAQFIVDGGGPGSDLIPALEAAGLAVITTTTRDIADACAGLVDAVTDGTLVHGPQPELDAAVAGAKKRPLGDGAFAFGRKISTVDITPLVAVALAHWAAKAAPERAPQVFSIAEEIRRIMAERAQSGAEAGETPADSGPITRADGSTFTRF